MNILAVGAHYDDIELGCAGSLIKHVKNKDTVHIFVITDSSYTSPDNRTVRDSDTARMEGQASADIIGAHLINFNVKTFHVVFDENLTSTLVHHVERLNIDTIYAPWVHDVHRDHQNACKAALMAGKHVPRFLMYQTNWYGADQPFRKQVFNDISPFFEQKLAAINAHKSEMKRTRNQWIDFVTCANRIDGLKTGVTYAESFEVIRYLL